MKENAQFNAQSAGESNGKFRLTESSADTHMVMAENSTKLKNVDDHILRDTTHVNNICHTKCTLYGSKELDNFNKKDMDHRKRLKLQVKITRDYIRYLNHVHRDISSYLNKLASNLAEITAEILERMKTLPDGVEIIAEAMINEIQTEHESETKRLKTKLQEFENSSKAAKSIVLAAEEVLLEDDAKFNLKSENLISSLKDVEKNLPECPIERYIYLLSVPKEGESAPLEERLGTFDKVSVPWRIEVKRIGSFRPESVASSRFITTMCEGGQDEAWVVWQWGPNIYLLDKSGNVLRTVNAGCKVDDICTDFDGNLVISSHDSKCIKIFDSEFNVKQSISMEKVPRGVEFVAKDEMVVCLVQNMHFKKGDQSSVARVKPDINTQTTVCNSDSLIQPWRVAVNINGDICVSDRNKGSVMIFDNEGNLKCSYSGADLEMRHPFAPHGICCDQFGQIFAVDYSNHTVHVLDPLGRFRGFLIMDQELEKRAIFMGTSSPFSIAIDQGGDVWVGNKFGFVTVLKYNI